MQQHMSTGRTRRVGRASAGMVQIFRGPDWRRQIRVDPSPVQSRPVTTETTRSPHQRATDHEAWWIALSVRLPAGLHQSTHWTANRNPRTDARNQALKPNVGGVCVSRRVARASHAESKTIEGPLTFPQLRVVEVTTPNMTTPGHTSAPPKTTSYQRPRKIQEMKQAIWAGTTTRMRNERVRKNRTPHVPAWEVGPRPDSATATTPAHRCWPHPSAADGLRAVGGANGSDARSRIRL